MQRRVLEDTEVDRVREVYEAEHARLWRSLVAFGGSTEIADEAAAEAFAQAIRRGGEVRDVSAWIWRSAFSIARGELKNRSDERQRSTTLPHSLESDTSAANDDSGAGLRRVLDSLAELSDRDRELLVLCHVGGWKPNELARRLGVRSGAVRVRLHRATRRARELLEGEVER